MAPPPTRLSDVADRPGASVSTNDALVDLFIERAIDLIRLEAGTRDKVLALLQPLEKEIVAKIAAIDPTGTATQRYQRIRLARLQATVDAAIQAAYRNANTLMASETREVVDVESTWTGNALNAAMRAEFADAGITRDFLATLVSDVLIQGAPTKEWWGRQAQGLSDRFADEMRRGVALGESNTDLIARVRGTDTQRGLMDLSRSSAERLVRSSVQTAANVAREAMYAKNDDLITGLRWHATLDTRTSEMCLVRDGHIYDVHEHTPKDGGPPWLEGPGKLHWNCRSTSVPVLKSWRDLGIDEDEVPDTTRASMDGQVPAAQTFGDWFAKQSVARQDTVLGAGKAQMYRDGKITLRDLLDQNGRPLTVEQLRAKVARK